MLNRKKHNIILGENCVIGIMTSYRIFRKFKRLLKRTGVKYHGFQDTAVVDISYHDRLLVRPQDGKYFHCRKSESRYRFSIRCTTLFALISKLSIFKLFPQMIQERVLSGIKFFRRIRRKDGRSFSPVTYTVKSISAKLVGVVSSLGDCHIYKPTSFKTLFTTKPKYLSGKELKLYIK